MEEDADSRGAEDSLPRREASPIVGRADFSGVNFISLGLAQLKRTCQYRAVFFKEFYKTHQKYVGLTTLEVNRVTPKAIRVGRIICEFGIKVLAPRAKRRRTWREIQASILECLLKGGATQNKVMTSTILNRDTTGDYLRDMISDGFAQVIGESKGHKLYSATEKGTRWLKVYKSLLDEEEPND